MFPPQSKVLLPEFAAIERNFVPTTLMPLVSNWLCPILANEIYNVQEHAQEHLPLVEHHASN